MILSYTHFLFGITWASPLPADVAASAVTVFAGNLAVGCSATGGLVGPNNELTNSSTSSRSFDRESSPWVTLAT